MAGRRQSNGSKCGTKTEPPRPAAVPPETERLQSALRDEERRYRTLVETNPVAIWQLDAEGRLVYANQALADLLQFETPEALIGQEYSQFFNARELEKVNKERERRTRGQSSTYEVNVAGRLGKNTPALIHGSPLLNESGRLLGIIGCLVDISELAAARAELRKAGERLEADVAARTRELDRVNLQLAQELADCERFESALLESEKRYRQFSEMTSDYCYSVTVTPENTAQSSWATAGYQRVTGRTREEVDDLGGWLRIVHPDDHPQAHEFVRQVLSNTSGTLEYRVVRPDGEIRWVRDRVLPEWSPEEQRVTRIYGAVDDITEARLAHEELQRQQEALEERVKERTIELREVNARLQEEIRERNQAEAQQRRISTHLREVLAAAEELLQCPDEDTLCRRAVELARERLGVERAGLFLFEPDGTTARGTYGTNLAGRTTREHHNTLRPDFDLKAYDRQPLRESPHSYFLKGPHEEWDEESECARTVGSGEVAVNEIYASTGRIGVFFNDQARTGLPLDAAHQQAISVYCQWLGSIIQQGRANAARAQSDHQFRAVFDNALEPMVLLDDAGLCLELNRAAETLLGLSTDEVRNRSVYEFLALEGDFEAYWADFLTQGTETGELPVRRFDGRIITAEYSAISNVVPGKHLAVLRDVSARRDAEEQVRKSELHFRSLIENSDEVITLLAPDGTVKYASQSAQRVLGYDPRSLIGRNVSEFVHPDDFPEIAAALARAVSNPGPPLTLEPRLRHRDGRWLTVEARAANHLSNPAIGGIVVNQRDITARRGTERLLSGQRRILEMIARSLPLNEILDALVLQIEEIATEVRGSIHLCRNDQLHGTSAPNLPPEYNKVAAVVPIREGEGSCGTAAFRRDVVVVKDIARNRLWKDYREVALAHGLRACWSTPIFARDGRILGTFALYRDRPGGPEDFEREVVDIASSLAGIAIERSQSEERLELIESAVHHTHDAILIASAGSQPRTIYVNPAMAQLTGYSLEELYRRRPGLLPGATERRNLAEALEQGESIEYSGSARRKDGSEYTAEWTVSPVRDAQGKISHWVWVERDVTARHRLEEQLRQSLKMDAIGRLAGGVAHDFNNLLAVIGGYSDLLLEEAEPGSRQRAGLEEIRKAAERATSLTRQLLAFARRDVVAPRSLDLNAIVTDMESMLRRLIGEHVEMQAILDPKLPPIRVDAGQIEQVIMNLGVNARDAMPQGGRLTWETLAVELDESAAVPLGLQPGTYVVLTASDTGLGIPEDVMPHIFEPFYTTKERGKGTGLGLATVYAIVTQNKGQIRVISEPDCGARFEIYFPADKSRRPVEVSEPGQPGPPAIENLTILLVEDEPQVRRLAAEILRSRGHTVMEAERGDAALQFAAHYPGDIDLLLADVMMPGMNGREVANRLVRMRPETRVLFMSGYMDDSAGKNAVSTDRDGFLQKPFTPDQLVTKVQERMRD